MTMTTTTCDGPTNDFRTDLIGLIPHMRAFARSLCNDRAYADDLAQDALAKALASEKSFTMGTNMKAWVFMILRNQFYSDMRRAWRSQPLDPEVAERTLVSISDPTAGLELDELRRALAMLPADMREALILVGAGGMSYEEVSAISGVAVGTVKSRVSRARDRLALIYAEGEIDGDDELPSSAMAAIMAQLDTYSRARAA